MCLSFALLVSLWIVPSSGFQSPPTKVVVVEGPAVACVGRFTDSLREHIVGKHDWIHSVQIEFVDSDPNESAEPSNRGWQQNGKTMRLKFELDATRQPGELARLLVQSRRYVGTEDWFIVQRIPLSEWNP